MLIAVAYDVENDRRRYRLARLLKNFGARVQKSVFECNLEPKQFTELEQRIGKVVKEQDMVRCYLLCENCRQRVIVLGPGKVTEDPEFYIG